MIYLLKIVTCTSYISLPEGMVRECLHLWDKSHHTPSHQLVSGPDEWDQQHGERLQRNGGRNAQRQHSADSQHGGLKHSGGTRDGLATETWSSSGEILKISDVAPWIRLMILSGSGWWFCHCYILVYTVWVPSGNLLHIISSYGSWPMKIDGLPIFHSYARKKNCQRVSILIASSVLL